MDQENSSYYDAQYDFNDPNDVFRRKKSTHSTEYSFKNYNNNPFYEDSVDHYLILNTPPLAHQAPSSKIIASPLNNQPGNKLKATSEAVKLRNKINAKKSRDRKKAHLDSVCNKLKQIQRQNQRLKQAHRLEDLGPELYCGRCKVRIDSSNLNTNNSSTVTFQENSHNSGRSEDNKTCTETLGRSQKQILHIELCSDNYMKQFDDKHGKQGEAYMEYKEYAHRKKQEEERNKSYMRKQSSSGKQPMELEFESPKFQDVDKARKGKMWIAIAIMMMIVGINIHGFDKEPIEINVKSSAITALNQNLLDSQNKESTLSLPILVKQVRSKTLDTIKDTRDNPQLSKLGKQRQTKDSESKNRKYGDQGGLINIVLDKLRVVTVEDYEKGSKEEETFEISKQFINQLHGEMDDIGRYI